VDQDGNKAEWKYDPDGGPLKITIEETMGD
jgi:hypothetical protein